MIGVVVTLYKVVVTLYEVVVTLYKVVVALYEVVVTLCAVVIFSSLYIQIVKEQTEHCGCSVSHCCTVECR